MKVNDIVMIIKNPPASIDLGVVGKVGIITEIETVPSGKVDYHIKTGYRDEFWYYEDEFRPATDEEKEQTLVNLLLKM